MQTGCSPCCFAVWLVYELRDSRNRERKYTQTIRALTDRLDAVKTVKTDVEQVKTDVNRLADDLSELRSDVGEIKAQRCRAAANPSAREVASARRRRRKRRG